MVIKILPNQIANHDNEAINNDGDICTTDAVVFFVAHQW